MRGSASPQDRLPVAHRRTGAGSGILRHITPDDEANLRCVTILDRLVTGAAWLSDIIRRAAAGARVAPVAAAVVLLVITAIPVLAIATSPYPTSLRLEQLERGEFSQLVSWVRLEGELRAVPGADDQRYTLHDLQDDERYVTVITPAAMQEGTVLMTGHLTEGITPEFGSIATVEADRQPVPPQDQPWPLILVPAFLSIPVLIGARAGYPTIRRDRAPASVADPIALGETSSGTWFGRIGSHAVDRQEPLDCDASIDSDRGLWKVMVDDRHSKHDFGLRKGASSTERVRTCTIHQCTPAVRIEGSKALVVLAFRDSATRDRFAARLTTPS